MAILVTGGAGYIGSHMVLALADRGEPVVVIDNLSTGFPWLLPPHVALRGGDVGDSAFVRAVIEEFGVTEIAHFAARIVVPESVANPLLYYGANTARSRTLLETAIAAGVTRFIFSSTAAVYGEVSGAPIGEDVPPNPVSPYGRSKLMTEWMLEDCARAHDFRFVALRYFNVAGADPQGRSGQSTPNATHLIKVAVQTALGQRPAMDIFGTDYPTPDGTCIRDYIHVTDLASAHVDALAHLRRGGESLILNCGYGRGFSVLEVVDVVRKVTGIDFTANRVARRPGDPAAIIAKSDRIRALLGWTPRHDDLEEIVRQAYEWERQLAGRNA
ncbi:UDP-glucose 4-epimerase GalE [Rhabdaerophilum calidifontis]|uniref:UDP-glucose 4-epimerase GalE n=1 Tax=Rhabdaerophilum calidifontis TaxID=2604328 RepID=UPI00123A1D99|nr:UDP-glucose 4-epimerase GalE [Rhabdaerophilum calidifontis]